MPRPYTLQDIIKSLQLQLDRVANPLPTGAVVLDATVVADESFDTLDANTVKANAPAPWNGPMSLTGNEITDAVRIAARSWSTSFAAGMVDDAGLLGVANLLPNGGFEVNTGTWFFAGGGTGSIAQDGTRAKYGTKSLKVVANGDAVAQGADAAIGSSGRAAVVGVTYTASAWVWCATPHSFTVQLAWYDASNTFVSNTISSITPVPAGAWTELTVTGAAPASAAKVGIRVRFSGTIADTFWVDGCQIEVGSTAHAYVETNGTTTADTLFFTPGQGVGIYRGATNLFRYGQCDAGGNWNTANAGTTRAIDATVPAPFSPQSMKYTTDGSVASQGCDAVSLTGQAAAAGTSMAGSVWFKGAPGQPYQCFAFWGNTDASFTVGATTTLTATGAWQLVKPAAVAVGTGKTGDSLRLRIAVSGTRAESFWVAHAMLEKGVPWCAPYVASSGGATATHGLARAKLLDTRGPLTSPIDAFNWTQGWFACRLRMGFDATAPPLGGAAWDFYFRIGNEFTGNRNTIDGIFGESSRKFDVESWVNGSGNFASETAAESFLPGDKRTIVIYWTASQIGISVSNATLVTVARSLGVQTVPITDVDIGASVGVDQVSSSFLWALGGSGTIAQTDVATLNALGDTCPDFATLPASAAPTIIWPCVDATTLDTTSDQWA